MPSTGLALAGSGSGDAGQEIWKPVMQKYLAGKDATPFDPPPAELVRSAGAAQDQLPRGRGGR